MIASIGVIFVGAIILFTGWTFIDPIVSIFIAALIGWNAFRIVLETVNILLEGTPRGLNMGDIRKVITGVDGVLSAHDVHVWCISSEHNHPHLKLVRLALSERRRTPLSGRKRKPATARSDAATSRS